VVLVHVNEFVANEDDDDDDDDEFTVDRVEEYGYAVDGGGKGMKRTPILSLQWKLRALKRLNNMVPFRICVGASAHDDEIGYELGTWVLVSPHFFNCVGCKSVFHQLRR
jgi:hypothetical protein